MERLNGESQCDNSEQLRTMFIYLITNKINGKQYVGQTTKDVNKRMCQHLVDKTYIGNALRRYGIESFNTSVIDSATSIDVLKEKEKYWIKIYDCKAPNGYNLTDGGDGLCNPSEEIRQKMSAAQKGKVGTPHTDEFKASLIGNKYAQGNKGRPLSEGHKEKIRRALMGNKNGIHTPEGIAKKIGNKYASKVRNVSISG